MMMFKFQSSFPLQKITHLGPATDFYKKLALDCSAQQIAVDLFMLNSQYADIASIGEYTLAVINILFAIHQYMKLYKGRLHNPQCTHFHTWCSL